MALWLPDIADLARPELLLPAGYSALGFFQGDCPCCATFPTTGSCPSCASAPETWELTVSGVTDGTCSTCDDDFNGTFNLIYRPGESPPIGFGTEECRWDTDELGGCSGGASSSRYILFRYGPDAYWYLHAYANPANNLIRRYRLATSSFDCLGSNTFNGFGVPLGDCATWPSSLTITPV